MAVQTSMGPADRAIRDFEDFTVEQAEERVASPETVALSDEEPPHQASLTEVEAEVLRTGLYPLPIEEEVPGQDEILRGGDPDVDPLENLYTGDEMPGGSMPTPDQNDVDSAGRIAGLSNADRGELYSAEEIIERRDEHRWENEPLSPKV